MQSTSERDSFGLVITHWGEGAAHDSAGQPISTAEHLLGEIGCPRWWSSASGRTSSTASAPPSPSAPRPTAANSKICSR